MRRLTVLALGALLGACGSAPQASLGSGDSAGHSASSVGSGHGQSASSGATNSETSTEGNSSSGSGSVVGSSSGAGQGGSSSSGGGTDGSSGSTGGTTCNGVPCSNGDVCCTQGGCAGQCVPDCRLAGSCPGGLTCDEQTGVCVPAQGSGGVSGSGASSSSSSGGETGGGPTGGGPGGGTTGGGPGGGPTGGGPTGGGPTGGGPTGGGPTGGRPTGGGTGGGPTGGGQTGGGPGAGSGGSSSSGGSSGGYVDLVTCPFDWDAGSGCVYDEDCPAGEACDSSTSTCLSTSICSYGTHAYPSSTDNSKNCRVLERDTCSCLAERLDAGVSAPFLKFSCNIGITVTTLNNTTVTQLTADSVPDRHDVYFDGGSCYEADNTTTYPDPWGIVPQSIVMNIPLSVGVDGGMAVPGGTVGLAIDGASIFNDSAGANKSIWTESGSFERCNGHANSGGVYHYHMEPYSITQDDDSLVGVMRDGYFIYGRKDPDGTEAGAPDGGVSYPYYGHVGYTIDSPNTPVFHYHVHYEAIDGGAGGGYFVTPSIFYGAMAPCTNCTGS